VIGRGLQEHPEWYPDCLTDSSRAVVSFAEAQVRRLRHHCRAMITPSPPWDDRAVAD
jgi:hypothetical protein